MFIDLLIILIILVGAYQGYKKGIVKGIVTLMVSGISFIATLLFVRPFAHVLATEFGLKEMVINKITPYLLEINPNLAQASKGNINTALTQTNVFQSLPKPLQESVMNQIVSSTTEGLNAVVGIVADRIIYVLSFMLLLMVLRTVLTFIAHSILSSFRLPILKQANQMMGIAFYSISYSVIGILIGSVVNFFALYNNIDVKGTSIVLNMVYGFLGQFINFNSLSLSSLFL